MEAWGLTDTGNVREENQDFYRMERLGPETLLAVVCDGMGGARAGNVASRLACEVFCGEVCRSLRDGMTEAEEQDVLCTAAKLANISVYEHAQLSEEFRGMGTTLVAALVRGLRVEIETNGAADLGELAALRARVGNAAPGSLSFTVDWKLPSSGMEQQMLPANFRLLGARDTVKFVCGQGDLPRALEVARQLDLPGRVPVYLSPCFGDIEPARIVEFMQENQMTWATAQVQLHKVIWPDVERGV